MVYSIDHEAELGSKNPDLLMPPASITKLMTAVLAEKALDLTTTITISAVADATPIGYTGQPDVRQGEVWLARDLLANVMVQSGNDASTAVAEAVSDTVAQFVDLMNATAAELGMTNTTFRNPHGLDDAEHLTTARDLIKMGRFAVDYPVIMLLARTNITFDTQAHPEVILRTAPGVFPGLLGRRRRHRQRAGAALLHSDPARSTPYRRAQTPRRHHPGTAGWGHSALGPRTTFGMAARPTCSELPGGTTAARSRRQRLSPGTPVLPSTPSTDISRSPGPLPVLGGGS
jgi:hypothetical protein